METEKSSTPGAGIFTPGRSGPQSAAQLRIEQLRKDLADAQSARDAEEHSEVAAAEELTALQALGGTVDPVARRGLVAVCRLLRDVQHNDGAHAAAQAKISALIKVLSESV